MLIYDGKGSGRAASVSKAQRLNVSAKSNPRAFYVSRDSGLSFNAIMPSFSATAGDYVFYLKNTSSTRDMFIDSFVFSALNAAVWKLFSVSGTAAGGTTITPSNMNLGKDLVADATCMGGGATITGLTLGAQIGTNRNVATAEAPAPFDGSLILSPGDAIAVEYDTGTAGLCELSCKLHYEDLNWY